MSQTLPVTDLHKEIEVALGRPLAEFVSEHRSNGQSWRRIAMLIHQSTQIEVTGEALRVWFVVRRVA